MHFWQDGEQNWHFVSEQGYKQMKQEGKSFPDICYATKYPIMSIPYSDWPCLNPEDLLQETSNYKSARYIALNSANGKELKPAPTTDEKGIFEVENHDINPLIFYRLQRPLKDESSLPVLDLHNYKDMYEDYGLKLELIPNYESYKSEAIINLKKDEYDRIVTNLKQFNGSLDEELIEAIETYFEKNTQTQLDNDRPTTVNGEDLVFASEELKNTPKAVVQSRIDAFMILNRKFQEVMDYVIMDETVMKKFVGGNKKTYNDTLSKLFMACKHLMFKLIKNYYIDKITNSLPYQNDTARLVCDRIYIRHRRDQGKIDNKGEWTMFGLAMNDCKKYGYKCLRTDTSQEKAWYAVFEGEGSSDHGGPYRESLENILDELQSSSLPLLVPTQNNKNDHGFNRDCWTINPSSTSIYHMEMFKFLGALIGMAFRSGQVIDFKLPPIFWKQLLGQRLTIDDLASSDAYAVQAITDLEKNKNKLSAETFSDIIDLSFTTQLSNGETVPLKPNGENIKVSFEEIDEYHELVLKARYEEGKKQIQAIREGFDIIFPISKIGILTWRDVEERVRGPREISTQALQSVASYEYCNSDNEHIQRFWRVFDTFTNQEKSKFLKFAWGRARLPPSDRLSEQRFKLSLISGDDPDGRFPLAHTCFFHVEIPKYTTDEACRTKILYAIDACGEIDTDNDPRSIHQSRANYDNSQEGSDDSDEGTSILE